MDPIILVYLMMFFFGIFFLLIFVMLHYRYLPLLFHSPKPKKLRSITFLVPAYNEQDNIENTVKALVDLDYPKNLVDIIVVNDGSKDKTGEIAKRLEKEYSNVKLFDKPNSGKADSLNQALKLAKGELVAVVDADSYPNKESLMNMVGHFDEKGVAAVTSRVLVKNKTNWLCRYQVLDYSIIAWTRKLLDFVNSVYVTNGPLSIYRRTVVNKVGGFDTENLTEDIEITWHILSEGYKTRMSYNAIVYTSVPEDLRTWINQRIRWNLGGLQTVQKYWRSMFRRGAFGYLVIPYVTSSFILALIGFALFIRLFWVKGTYHLISIYYAFQDYNPFLYFEFSFSFSFLLFLGIMFFALAIGYYKVGFRNSETGNRSVLDILIYSFVYRALYIVPLLGAIYKLAKGDLRWYTK